MSYYHPCAVWDGNPYATWVRKYHKLKHVSYSNQLSVLLFYYDVLTNLYEYATVVSKTYAIKPSSRRQTQMEKPGLENNMHALDVMTELCVRIESKNDDRHAMIAQMLRDAGYTGGWYADANRSDIYQMCDSGTKRVYNKAQHVIGYHYAMHSDPILTEVIPQDSGVVDYICKLLLNAYFEYPWPSRSLAASLPYRRK